MYDDDFGHVCRRKRIHISGQSDFGNLSYLKRLSSSPESNADTASAACPVREVWTS